MGKVTGFLDWERVNARRRDKAGRLGDSKEFYLPLAEEELKRQAGRCMDCGVPFCQQGCPLGNMIPDWNDLVYRGNFKEAYQRLAATNPLPELTGRLCPAPCEPACVLTINQPAVTIEQIEKEIIERAFAEGWVTPAPPKTRTGKRVAIVGSGPAGLAAAQALNSVGHAVTVFERDARPGGLCRYGIPDFKLEKPVLDRRLAVFSAEGIEFACGVNVGQTLSWSQLRKDFDAVLLAIGAQAPRDVELPGRELSGIHFALDYLGQQNRVIGGDSYAGPRIDAADKHVVILGGGDTGSDCLGTALRQGARKVTQVQLWAAPPAERVGDNPWPQWPIVFRVSSSQEEGGEREFRALTTRFVGEHGKLAALEIARVADDKSKGPPRPVPGSEFLLPAELAILAIGYRGAESGGIAVELGCDVHPSGNFLVDENYLTPADGVFAAGDAMRGASLIVWALTDGREAARSIDAYLRGGTSVLPTRGRDEHFGGLTYKRQGSENR